MGRRTHSKDPAKSHTLPSSPAHSSSSSDFEFTISISPRNKSTTTTNLCPADDLFYKGQLLPLHLSPRISMVRTLLLASSSTSSSSDTTTTASRDSSGSSNDSHSSFSSDLILLHAADNCDSSRPSSVTEDDEFKRIHNGLFLGPTSSGHQAHHHSFSSLKRSKYYFSRLSRFSSVFRKEPSTKTTPSSSSATSSSSSPVKRMSATAKEVIRKYLKKVKPLYEKLSQSQNQKQKMGSMRTSTDVTFCMKKDGFFKDSDHHQKGKGESNNDIINAGFSHSFSGNLRYPRRPGRSYVSSCPSSMRSSPSHSGILCNKTTTSTSGMLTPTKGKNGCGLMSYGSHDASSMEELQNAIQGAIAHCKNSMLHNKTMVSNEI